MTTATQQTLLERFNSAESKKARDGRVFSPDRNAMTWELGRLLADDKSGYSSLNNQALIAEYKENFDWEVEYEAVFHWEVGGSYTTLKDCQDEAELDAYLKGNKEYPTADEIKASNDDWYCDLESDIYEVEHCSPRYRVKNLRIKQPKHTYSVVVSIESDKEEPSIGEDFGNWIVIAANDSRCDWVVTSCVVSPSS